jgi:hypothetical protein
MIKPFATPNSFLWIVLFFTAFFQAEISASASLSENVLMANPKINTGYKGVDYVKEVPLQGNYMDLRRSSTEGWQHGVVTASPDTFTNIPEITELAFSLFSLMMEEKDGNRYLLVITLDDKQKTKVFRIYSGNHCDEHWQTQFDSLEPDFPPSAERKTEVNKSKEGMNTELYLENRGSLSSERPVTEPPNQTEVIDTNNWFPIIELPLVKAPFWNIWKWQLGWRYIQSKDKPAVIVSRSTGVEEVVRKRWGNDSAYQWFKLLAEECNKQTKKNLIHFRAQFSNTLSQVLTTDAHLKQLQDSFGLPVWLQTVFIDTATGTIITRANPFYLTAYIDAFIQQLIIFCDDQGLDDYTFTFIELFFCIREIVESTNGRKLNINMFYDHLLSELALYDKKL